MKKTIISAIALIIAAFSANAQISFGVEGGATANWIPGTMKGIGATVIPKIGFYAGAFGIVDISDNMVAQVEACYALKGYAEKTAMNSKYDLGLSYIEVPVMVGWKLANDMFSVKIGPEFDFCVGGVTRDGKYKYTNKELPIGYKPFQFLLALQLTYMFNDNFGVDVKFNAGVTRTFNNYELEGQKIEDKGRAAGIRIGVRYCFN